MLWLDWIVLAACAVMAVMVGVLWARWVHRARRFRDGDRQAQEILARAAVRPRGNVKHGRNGR